MSYQTRNPKAVHQPLRSVPLFRPVSVLGSSFVQAQNPLAYQRRVATREAQLARARLEQCERAYAASRADLGAMNRRGRKDRHDRDITPDRIIKRMLGDCFRTMNRRRGALLQAKRALHTAQIAVERLEVVASPEPAVPAATHPAWFERRIGTLTAQKHAALRDAAVVRQHAAELQAELDQLRGAAA